jgi:hypothetical protein
LIRQRAGRCGSGRNRSQHPRPAPKRQPPGEVEVSQHRIAVRQHQHRGNEPRSLRCTGHHAQGAVFVWAEVFAVRSPASGVIMAVAEAKRGRPQMESRRECLDPNWRCCAVSALVALPSRRRRFTVAQIGQTRDPAPTLPEIWRMSDYAFLALTEERHS